MSLATVVFTARHGDLLAEARQELTPVEFEQFLELAAAALSKHFGDAFEARWQADR